MADIKLWAKVFGSQFVALQVFIDAKVENEALKAQGFKINADVIDYIAERAYHFGRMTKDNSVLSGACAECGFSREQLIKRLAGPQALNGYVLDEYKQQIAPTVPLDGLAKLVTVLRGIQEPGQPLKAGYVVALPKQEMPEFVEQKGGKALVGRKISGGLYHYKLGKMPQVVVEAAPAPVAETPVAVANENPAPITEAPVADVKVEAGKDGKRPEPVTRHVANGKAMDESDFGFDNSLSRYPAKKGGKKPKVGRQP